MMPMGVAYGSAAIGSGKWSQMTQCFRVCLSKAECFPPGKREVTFGQSVVCVQSEICLLLLLTCAWRLRVEVQHVFIKKTRTFCC
ncbi:hypothetical protein AGOR_G00077890 [Albula goreensis]|uniref:Uncharacterized protein n=1 Tax=Albula goreensis TaxID=1534307 RepID=A0A8T3DP39_9TELE|nr:hypothetical protein AGOR_G00077890 [Albula goreensis]